LALILLLETTTINCSVALAEDDKLVAIKEDKTPGYSHAEKLQKIISLLSRVESFL